jgi:two-component system phosphate regulon sensor histidine kinase PhoR
MSNRSDACTESVDELAVQQSLRYAEDLSRVYALEKRRRRELEQTNERLSSVLDSMSEGVAAVDDEQNVVMINHRFRELLCAGQDDPMGRLVCEVVDLEGFADFLDGVEAGFGETVADLESPRLGNRVLRVQANRLERGGLVLVVRDVTSEQRVKELKQEFLALISHELRTPLNGLLGFLQILEMEQGDREDADGEALIHMRMSADRLNGAVNELLKVADLEALELEKPREPVAVGDVLDAALRDARSLAESRGVEVVLHDASRGAMVSGHPPLLREMLEHLVRNAVQFSPRGQEVRVLGQWRGEHVRLAVEDDGPGIPGPELERVFESFYQVQGYMRRDKEGLGLGLTLARRIARLHGGDVLLESELGAGTRCEVRLPLHPMLEKDGDGHG